MRLYLVVALIIGSVFSVEDYSKSQSVWRSAFNGFVIGISWPLIIADRAVIKYSGEDGKLKELEFTWRRK